jgi:hypothetical protein
MNSTRPRRTHLTARAAAAAAVLALTGTLAGCGEDAMALGDSADIDFYPIDGGTEAQGPGTIAVTDVREGAIEELTDGGFQLDPEELARTPLYVDVSFENTGDGEVDLRDPGAEDADGNIITSLTILDLGDAPPFEPCPAIPKTLAAGGTAEGCAIVLVPEGAEIEKIYFLPGGDEDFIYWESGL